MKCCYVVISPYIRYKIQIQWQYENEKIKFFLSGLVNVIVYLDDFRSEEEIRKCVRYLKSGLVDGMVKENVGNAKE
jgi:hypothetical protein